MRLTDWQLAFEQHLLAETPTASSGFAATLLGGPTLDVDTGLGQGRARTGRGIGAR